MNNQIMNASPVGEDAIEYLNRLLSEEERLSANLS